MTSRHFQVQKLIDLTGDWEVPGEFIVKRTSVLIKAKARDTQDNSLDLTNIAQIKVEAKKRFTSQELPIFTASLDNGKISITDVTSGEYEISLAPDDTDFIGDAKAQALYLFDDGSTHKSLLTIILFKEGFIEPD